MARPAASPVVMADSTEPLVLTRRFAAAPAAVFHAWIEPAELVRWLGPRSVKAEVEAMEARPGGRYRIAMHHEDSKINIVEGVYRELVPGERLVFTWGWAQDCAGGKAGQETLVTITFRADGAETEMTLRQELFADKASRDSHDVGWTGSFDKLAEVLAGLPGRR
jgi:uncharacterized protein YndB with AHSA1/START domain